MPPKGHLPFFVYIVPLNYESIIVGSERGEYYICIQRTARESPSTRRETLANDMHFNFFIFHVPSPLFHGLGEELKETLLAEDPGPRPSIKNESGQFSFLFFGTIYMLANEYEESSNNRTSSLYYGKG